MSRNLLDPNGVTRKCLANVFRRCVKVNGRVNPELR